MITQLYTTIIYEPILNLLVYTYNILPGDDMGIAIIVLTVFIKLLLAPQSKKALDSQKRMQSLQPKIKEIKERHKNDKVAEGQAIMQLYKESGVSPMSSCLPLLLQIPLFIALYSVCNSVVGKAEITGLYSFVAKPENINPLFIGIFDLSKFNWTLTIIATISQYLQGKTMSTQKADDSDPNAKAMQMQMLYVMPLITILIAWQTNMPSGVLIYLITSTLFQVAQQVYMNKKP